MKKHKKFICETCKVEFTPKSHGKNYKYCSIKCRSNNSNWKKLNSESHKGKASWNKGIPNTWTKPGFTLSAETKKKISLSKKGKPSSNKGKQFLNMRGENSPHWKGGKGTERHQAMGKLEYRLWRTAVFMRDGYTCQKCRKHGGYLEADHIKPWALYPELRYAIDNGRTLCKFCHLTTNTWGRNVFKTVEGGGIYG